MRLYEFWGIGKKTTVDVKPADSKVEPEKKAGEVDSATAEANLKKWFGKSIIKDRSGKPRKVFHGSVSDVSSGVFRPSKSGVYGPGIYLSTSSKTASNYATGKRRSVNGEEIVQGNVLPVYIKMERPLTEGQIKDNQQFRKELLKVLNPTTVKGLLGLDNKSDEIKNVIRKLKSNTARPIDICYLANINTTLSKGIYSIIRKHFDGIVAGDQDEGHWEYIVWYSTQVKSAIGNNGHYSTNSSNITETDVKII